MFVFGNDTLYYGQAINILFSGISPLEFIYSYNHEFATKPTLILNNALTTVIFGCLFFWLAERRLRWGILIDHFQRIRFLEDFEQDYIYEPEKMESSDENWKDVHQI